MRYGYVCAVVLVVVYVESLGEQEVARLNPDGYFRGGVGGERNFYRSVVLRDTVMSGVRIVMEHQHVAYGLTVFFFDFVVFEIIVPVFIREDFLLFAFIVEIVGLFAFFFYNVVRLGVGNQILGDGSRLFRVVIVSILGFVEVDFGFAVVFADVILRFVVAVGFGTYGAVFERAVGVFI